MKLLNFLRTAGLTAGLALVLSTVGAQSAQAAVIYSFVGDCTPAVGTAPCTGQGTGTLTLQDSYTPGSGIAGLSQIISFAYTSNTHSFTITAPNFVGGLLPATSGAAFFTISDGTNQFDSNLSGSWGSYDYIDPAYTLVNGDANGVWTLESVGEVPEPSSFLLIGGGVAALAALRRRKS